MNIYIDFLSYYRAQASLKVNLGIRNLNISIVHKINRFDDVTIFDNSVISLYKAFELFKRKIIQKLY